MEKTGKMWQNIIINEDMNFRKDGGFLRDEKEGSSIDFSMYHYLDKW